MIDGNTGLRAGAGQGDQRKKEEVAFEKRGGECVGRDPARRTRLPPFLKEGWGGLSSIKGMEDEATRLGLIFKSPSVPL